MRPTTINEETLRTLVAAGSVREVAVVASGPTWHIEVQISSERRALRSKREELRTWRSLDTITRYLRRTIGVGRWTVEAADYAPEQRRIA